MIAQIQRRFQSKRLLEANVVSVQHPCCSHAPGGIRSTLRLLSKQCGARGHQNIRNHTMKGSGHIRSNQNHEPIHSKRIIRNTCSLVVFLTAVDDFTLAWPPVFRAIATKRGRQVAPSAKGNKARMAEVLGLSRGLFQSRPHPENPQMPKLSQLELRSDPSFSKVKASSSSCYTAIGYRL